MGIDDISQEIPGGPPLEAEKKRRLPRGFWLKGPAMAAAVVGAIDTAGVGVERVNFRAWYEQSLAQAEQGYAGYREQQLHNPEGPMPVSSFEDYLHNIEMMPTQREFEAVARLMEEYDRPIRVYSGTRLLTRLFQFAFSTDERKGHYRPEGLLFDVHGIYLERSIEEGGRMRIMGQEDFDTIVAELAHAFQNEQGRLSAGRIIRDLFVMLTEGKSYDDLYDIPGTYEWEAHDRIEPMLQDQVTLYESETLIANRLPYFLNELGLEIEEPLTSDSFSFDAYTRMIQAVTRGMNAPIYERTSYNRAAEEVLSFLELLDGFDGERRQDGEMGSFLLRPNERHYRAILEVLGGAKRPDTPITERRSVPPSEDPHDALAKWREITLEARRFEEFQGPMFAIYLNDAHILPQGERFTRAVYDRMMDRLGEAYPMLRYSPGGHDNEGAGLFGLLNIVNNVCFYDRECSGRYGVLELGESVENSTMPSYQGQVVKGEEHYRALRRLFDRNQGETPAFGFGP
jgi:hypothetical protein